VYDLVTEEEYVNLVQERRQKQDFVVEDGEDFGYGDDGEEEEWQEGGTKKQKVSKVAQEGRKKKEQQRTEPTQRVHSIFLGGRKQYVGPDGRPENAVGQEEEAKELEGDEMMNNLLGDLDQAVDNAADDKENKPRTNLQKVAMFGSQQQLDNVDYSNVMYNSNIQGSGEEAMHTDGYMFYGGKSAQSEWAAPPPRKPTQQSMTDLLAGFDEDVANAAASGVKQEFCETNSSATPRVNVKSEFNSITPVAAPMEQSESDWFSMQKEVLTSTSTTVLADDDASGLSVKKNPDDDTLSVYWYDLHEEPGKAGTVYVFGKVLMNDSKPAQSCCLKVKNLDRNLYILPRKFMLEDAKDPSSVTDKEVQMIDVFNEIKLLMKTCGVSKFGIKPVDRKYCFSRDEYLKELDGSAKEGMESLLDPDLGVPDSTKFIKLVYSFAERALPRGTVGRTFSAILGAKSQAKELFILKRDLMGPGWLKIKNAKQLVGMDKQSWCKYEFLVDHQKHIKKISTQEMDSLKLEVPKFSVLCLSLKTVLNEKSQRNEVAAITYMFHKGVSIEGETANKNEIVHQTYVRQLTGQSWPFDMRTANKKKIADKHLQLLNNENALLGVFCSQVQKLDPDVILGHDLHGFQIEVLLHRMNAHRIPHWSKLGRLKKNNMPNLNTKSSSFALVDSGAVCGRVMCDTMTSAKELIRENEYSLAGLAASQLKSNCRVIDPVEVPQFYNSSKDLNTLIGCNENEAWLTLGLLHKLVVLPLTKVLTGLTGNLWNRSLRSARAERIEYLLLHEFHRLKYIVPEKYTGQERKAKEAARNIDSEMKQGGKRRKKPQYSGGLVLEPKKGFYDKFVLLLDFNSLYPSIIQEFNICFTTVKHYNDLQEGQFADLPEEGTEAGILPKVIYRLIERRKTVKNMLKTEKNPGKAAQLDIRQKALKLVANSMYGCLGFGSSRFFCQPLAAMITSQGRDILQKTVELTNSLGHDVIYGDTDSIMVNTNVTDLADVKRIGKEIKKLVNDRYRILEIEMDGIYKNMLLLRKKKYAALSLTETPEGVMVAREMKGLDMVRRDWSSLSRDAGDFVLRELMSGKQREDVIENIHNFLRKLAEDVRNNQVSLEKYIIRKCLTKAPRDYPDKTNQPHVMVAEAMTADGQTVRVGDHIPFIVCEQSNDDTADSKGNIASRSHHPSAIQKAAGALVIDSTWYLSNQVLPPVARLCDPIEETDAARIADCLGLDPKRFHNFSKSNENGMQDEDELLLSSQADDESRFKDCERLSLCCPLCQSHFELEGVFKKIDDAVLNAVKTEGSVAPKAVSGLHCPNPVCPGIVDKKEAEDKVKAALANKLVLACRSHIDRYYQDWAKCSECGSRTTQVCVRNDNCWRCSTGKMVKEYSALDLYTQLTYYQYLFDVRKALNNLAADNASRKKNNKLEIEHDFPPAHQKIFWDIYRQLEETLKTSGYHYISLASLFSTVMTLPKHKF